MISLAEQILYTKGNLIGLKKSLQLAKTGFELLDKKRNILIREIMSLINVAEEIQNRIDLTYSKAYKALQNANIRLGIVDEIAKSIPEENGISITYKSVMGIEVPTVTLKSQPVKNYFGYHKTSITLDEAYQRFDEVKKLTAELAEIENTVYRLAQGIKKTQKRANALKNIIIPRFESQIKSITEFLEEKEREEFTRLKFIKQHISK